MARKNELVPYGFEQEKPSRKGTLWVYDPFETEPARIMEIALQTAKTRSFAKVVLYPLHEETVRRMSREPVAPYYKRERQLEQLLVERKAGSVCPVTIERWEGKRKAYTPMEAALRHLSETYPAPYFMLVSVDTAERFATYEKPFEEWIRKLRLLLLPSLREPSHPRLLQHANRWELLPENESI